MFKINVLISIILDGPSVIGSPIYGWTKSSYSNFSSLPKNSLGFSSILTNLYPSAVEPYLFFLSKLILKGSWRSEGLGSSTILGSDWFTVTNVFLSVNTDWPCPIDCAS